MPVIKNKPWKPGHPFLNGAIVFGQKRPNSSEKHSTDEGQPGPLDGRLASAITPEELTESFKRMKNFQGIIPASNPPEEAE